MKPQSLLAWFLVSAIAVSAGACRRAPSAAELAPAIREELARITASAADPAVANDVQNAYNRRNASPMWVADGQAKAVQALAVIRTATEHGLHPADYGDMEIESRLDRLQGQRDAEDPIGELAQLDVMVTSAMFHLGHDVALGRVKPGKLDARWKHQRQAPDLVATLEQASATDLNTWLSAIRPRHPEYVALQGELQKLRTAASSGDSSTPPDKTGLSVDARIKLIEMNLERWRWLPDDLGFIHILVNIPSYTLTARENGSMALTMRVIVGAADHSTPLFSGGMNSVVFSPYWNIPDSIVEGEIAAREARDPAYLKRNNIDILRVTGKGTENVSPASVNWDDTDELKKLSFRQRPGVQNALGHVKFMLPNPYDVYLHDTPADALFAQPGRALSHGCVRLERPEALATFVLRDQPEWDESQIRAAMRAEAEKPVALKKTIPVHIVYMTAWVDEAGAVQFGPDVYGHDAAQAKLE